MNLIEVRCENCNKLLFKARGKYNIEIKCDKCKLVHEYKSVNEHQSE